ncbi:BZ3500_MvSof-1268-A1-R1_Chr1-3g02168 [Microbotryum saponariae]|uniref:BZ3500_MvSof-1268-A1-R1_Chr1-3g02168 protein n=1 Tax=Microbotryum saponariae TaxID=289078 RepID=A0A2X0MSR9_9BASI|nr:BZ3500_MvSof-1268-A1-R1_Chr1-3g02168 [Microbotryum saponariae]SCZ95554.1 BZ3501_MvSof-1269-A2-R1_Chr1-3g01771 [Microbotryum saponariae]
MTMWSLVPKPSISTSSWFNVDSRSSLPPNCPPLPRLLPMASISSMKMMHGAFFLAVANKSRTREGPTPTNISTNSDPETDKKGTPASPAVALASKVLPVPGGPESIAPRGILAPSRSYFAGSLRNLTNSIISSLASSMPATSLNLTLRSVSGLNILALLLPTPKMPPGPPPPPPPIADMPPAARFEIQKSRPARISVGAKCSKVWPSGVSSW